MAVDVASGSYVLCHVPQSSNIADLTDGSLSTNPDGTTAQANDISPPPFRYGMIHNIKSLFWITTWFLLHTHPKGTEVHEVILQTANSIFSHDGHIDKCIMLLITQQPWHSILVKVHQSF